MLFVVAAALINETKEILLQMRPEGKAMAGLWEFPGGKVEPEESPENALVRELAEELGVKISPRDLTPLTFASEPLGERHMVLILYTCHNWSGEPSGLEKQQIGWISIDDMPSLPMPPADLPFIGALQTYLKNHLS